MTDCTLGISPDDTAEGRADNSDYSEFRAAAVTNLLA